MGEFFGWEKQKFLKIWLHVRDGSKFFGNWKSRSRVGYLRQLVNTTIAPFFLESFSFFPFSLFSQLITGQFPIDAKPCRTMMINQTIRGSLKWTAVILEWNVVKNKLMRRIFLTELSLRRLGFIILFFLNFGSPASQSKHVAKNFKRRAVWIEKIEVNNWFQSSTAITPMELQTSLSSVFNVVNQFGFFYSALGSSPVHYQKRSNLFRIRKKTSGRLISLNSIELNFRQMYFF